MKNSLPILFCFGTRPEWLKIKPILEKISRADYRILFTGQHEDLLNDVATDYRIVIENGVNRLDDVVSSCMLQFPNDDFSYTLIQGDTASALGCALASFHRKIKIIYLESGLRSHDIENPYPEEGYRQMISRLASINFAPTELSAKNLESERVMGEIHVVGNSVLDNLIHYDKGYYGDNILITMHRRENHDIMHEWFKVINQLAIDYPQYKFIIPLHPNPKVQKHRDILTNVKVIDPLSHSDIIEIVRGCRLLITDSGGLQEEGSFFNKKIIVCRKTTERPEGLDTGHLYMCKGPLYLEKLFKTIADNPYIIKGCPYGDGHTSQRIINYLYNR